MAIPDMDDALEKAAREFGEIKAVGLADDLNAEIKIKNPSYDPSYWPETKYFTVSLTQETKFVRVFGGKDKNGNVSGIYSDWIMPAKDIEGLTPTEIALKYSLPSVPKKICDVVVPAGTRIEVSCANPILIGKPDGGGGVQYNLIDGYHIDWFINSRRLN